MVIKYHLVASAPYLSIVSNGFTTLPNRLLILLPFLSNTKPLETTVLYSNVDGFSFKENYISVEQRPEIDQWILSSLNSLTKKVTELMDDYEPTNAGRLIETFVDEHLSNWYVRLCRRRFWKGDYEQRLLQNDWLLHLSFEKRHR